MNRPKKLALCLAGSLSAVALAGWLFVLAPPNEAPPPDTHPAAVWQRVRELGRYRFTADLLQNDIPLPSLTNVGRAGRGLRRGRLRFCGQVERRARHRLRRRRQVFGSVGRTQRRRNRARFTLSCQGVVLHAPAGHRYPLRVATPPARPALS